MARFYVRVAAVVGFFSLAHVPKSLSLLTAAEIPSFDLHLTRTSQTMCFMKKDDELEGNNVRAQTWNPLRLGVLRLGLTEPAMTSPLNYGKYNGEFKCAYCGLTLFDSEAKYDSGSGWPSFWRTATPDSVQYKRELDGRLECQCKRCSSHLGHVFLDGPRPATVPEDLLSASPQTDPRSTNYLPRFCINGAALKYQNRHHEQS